MRSLNRTVALAVILLPAAALGAGAYLGLFDVPAEATYVGAESCLECHDDIGTFYQHTPHAAARNAQICEACHGPGSLHVAGGGDGFIIGPAQLATLDGRGKAQMCLQCHGGVGTHWQDGPHAGTEVSCNSCHADQAHFGGAARPLAEFRNRSEFCLQCHTQQVTDFRLPFRHRVLEGEVSCLDCHDAHGGFDQADWNGRNAVCLDCHTEMAGPFVFEHEAVSDEDCTSCHRPHGSQHDELLTQDGNGLCLQCHVGAHLNADDGWEIGDQGHAGLLLGEGRCYDCHTHVHGSNVSPTLRDR